MVEKINVPISTKIATYDELMELTKKDSNFFFKDCFSDGRLYRIFTYKPMGWVSFTEPASMDCRGIMFDITDGGSSTILVSLPPRKFFEYEHDTRDHTLGRIGDKMIKLDGSLISTYIHQGKKVICLKSKASLKSPQVHIAESILSKNIIASDGTSYLTKVKNNTFLELEKKKKNPN